MSVSLDISIWKELQDFIDFASWSLNVYAHLHSFLADTLTHSCTVSREYDTAGKSFFPIRDVKP